MSIFIENRSVKISCSCLEHLETLEDLRDDYVREGYSQKSLDYDEEIDKISFVMIKHYI